MSGLSFKEYLKQTPSWQAISVRQPKMTPEQIADILGRAYIWLGLRHLNLNEDAD